MEDHAEAASTPLTPDAPYPARPGEWITLGFKLTPEQEESTLEEVQLIFQTQTPPLSPALPPPPQAPSESVLGGNSGNNLGFGSPEMLQAHLMGGYQIALETYENECRQREQDWAQEHPVRSFTVIAKKQAVDGSPHEKVRFVGQIPIPKTTMPGSETDSTIYAGEYHLEKPNFFQSTLQQPIIQVSAGAESVIERYTLIIDKDYLAPPPPAPTVETIEDLDIEAPQKP